MKLFKIILILCFIQLFVHAQTPPPTPKIPDTFSTRFEIRISDEYGTHVGSGEWAANQPANKAREYTVFDKTEYGYAVYDRYDLGKQYDLNSQGNCTVHTISGNLPDIWGWVKNAHFEDTVGHGKDAIDVWIYRMGYAELRLGVHHYLENTPVYLIRQSRDRRVVAYFFNDWNTTTPADSIFAVPDSCPTSVSSFGSVDATGACIARATTLSRAKTWVAEKVPYNQGALHDGYREDCSGYVSMTWESSKPGHTTSTFHEIAHPITKEELKEGDCLLFAAEHVVYFGGWTNSAKTEYQAYEETNPKEGTVTRATPYPYWYSQSSFKPYRFNNICA